MHISPCCCVHVVCQGQTLPPKHLPEHSPARARCLWYLINAHMALGPLSPPYGTAHSHITDGVQWTLAEGDLIVGQTPQNTKTSGHSPMAGAHPRAYGKATTSPRRTSSEDTESSGRVIPLIQSILIHSLLKTFLGVENYLIKSCRHYLCPEAWLTFIILIPKEVYFTLGFVPLLIEAGPSKQKRKHV